MNKLKLPGIHCIIRPLESPLDGIVVAPTLDIVVPCFNEEAVLDETFRQLSGLLADMVKNRGVSPDSRLYFVDDGSRDATWSMIKGRSASDHLVCGVKLSRNRGHQNALLAGLEVSTGEIVITVDADLQDDIHVIPRMVADYRSGSDIVYGVRSSRGNDTFFKRHTAQLFYKLMNRFGVTTIYNHADYRLMSRRAIESLSKFDERNMYLRGIIPLIGFRTSVVAYERRERFAGESKYPLSKMLSLALDGITSFSTMPLKMITMVGFLFLRAPFWHRLPLFGFGSACTRCRQDGPRRYCHFSCLVGCRSCV
jgi:glycosyltransferase involved in cell wall biosynthesis